MSAVDNSLAGLTLDDVLGKAKRAAPPPAQNKAKQSAPTPAQNKAKHSDSRSSHNKAKQRERSPPAQKNKAKHSDPTPSQNRKPPDAVPDDTSTKEKMSWKVFREKFRLNKAAGSAWTSSIHIPASDVNVQGNRSQLGRRTSFADANHADDGGGRPPAGKPRPLLARRTSVRFESHDSGDTSMPGDGPPSRSFKPQNAHHHSTSDDEDDDDEDDEYLREASVGKERSLSAREAVASQEAAEAAAAAAAEEEDTEGEEPVKMSLMDLLGETGSSYIDEDDDEYYEEEEEEEEEEIVQATGTQFTCCVCKVDITSSAFMPCEHTFCRLCSKELSVHRGCCPLCNGFVSEILHIF
ncbi:hypothetical protein GQ457_08G020650 [Hibiscus cannabinus]